MSDYNETTKLPGYLAWLYAGTWNMFRGHPLLTVWVSPALPFLALLLSVILLIKRKGNKVLLIAWAFPLLYWATLALAASDVRALCSAAFLHATADCHHSLTYA